LALWEIGLHRAGVGISLIGGTLELVERRAESE
jgi:hypothetical protein